MSGLRRAQRSFGWSIGVGALVLAFSALPLGCGGDEQESAAGDASTSSSTGAVSQGSETTTSSQPGSGSGTGSTGTSSVGEDVTDTSLLSSSEEPLTDGLVRAGGFITRAWNDDGVGMIEIDYADFLTGDEAAAAASAAGDESPPPNDYYIRNVNPQLRAFSVAPDVVVTIPGGDPSDPTVTDWAGFTAAFPEVGAGHYWWIERRGREVQTITGQWVP